MTSQISGQHARFQMVSRLIVLTGLLFGGAIARGELVDRIVASVNEQIVTQSDQKLYKKRLEKGSFVDEILIPDDETRKKILSDDNLLLQVLIDEKILDDEVKRENLQATIEQVEQKIRSITQRNRITRAELKQAIQSQGGSFAEYQQFIRMQLERQNLIGKNVKSKIQVSDEEVAAAYLAKRPKGAGDSFEYKVAHIVFLINSGEDETTAKSKAQLVLQKLKENKSFESLAQEYSQDPRPSADAFFGDFKTGEMSKEFEDALRNLAVGEHSVPVRSRAGLHILKLNGKKLISDPQFEAEKDRIRAQLEEVAYKRQFKFWLEQRRADAIIKVNAT
jgi:peptidyl-prolyl cis-trans isomerase SurA